MITQRSGLMKYIPVFHPSGVGLRSKSVPDGFVTKEYTLMHRRVGSAHRDRNGGRPPNTVRINMALTSGDSDQLRAR